jgi:hypothetical protein
MKVYVNNYNFYKIIEYDSSYTKKFIYSDEGIFGFKNNKLYSMEIVDSEVETILFKGYEFLIDKSEMLYSDIVYHIPFDHIFCEEVIFKKNMGDFTFVKKVFFEQVSYYFEIEGKLESFMLEKLFNFIL